jgi:hypothetical protein
MKHGASMLTEHIVPKRAFARLAYIKGWFEMSQHFSHQYHHRRHCCCDKKYLGMDVWQGTRTQLTPLSRASKTPEGNLAPLQHMRPVFVTFIGGSSSFNGDETRDVRIAPTFFSGLFLAAWPTRI